MALNTDRSSDEDDDLKEYDLEHYDDTDEENVGEGMGMFGNVKALAYHESNEEDPYITLKEVRSAPCSVDVGIPD